MKRTELVETGLISPSTMVRLRNNRNVSLRSLELIAAYMDCGITDLFDVDI